MTHPWNIKKDPNYRPKVDIILPTYNEEEVILQRLKNLSMVSYPKDLMHIVVIDSGSTDNTPALEKKFARENPNLNMTVIEEEERRGKARALNLGLRFAEGEIIVTTDAGDFWGPSVLRCMLPYLADPTVGAVAGFEELLNPSESSATRSEVAYREAHNYVRLGESKIHSTLMLHGGLTAYKRSAMDKFDEKSGNDEAVAVDLMSKGFRCIVISEVKSRYNDYSTWRGKATRKVTRAWALIDTLIRCLRLAVKGNLKLPNSIMLPNVYIYLLNPMVGLLFYAFGVLTILQYPILLLLPALLAIFKQTRTYLFAFVSHNIFSLIGLVDHLRGTRKHVVWKKVQC